MSFILKEAGERGGVMAIQGTPFDVLSCIEGLEAGYNHYSHRLEEYLKQIDPDADKRSWGEQEMVEYLQVKMRDCKENIVELQTALDDRNRVIRGS